MHRHACRLVDDYHVIVFVNDANRLGSDWRLVSVKGVGNDVSVLDDCSNLDGLTIESDVAPFYGILLKHINICLVPPNKHVEESAHIVLLGSVPELRRKYRQ